MESKRERVRAMFGRVAGRYDWLNGVLSFGMHHAWRRFSVAECEFQKGGRALDVATGTADFAVEFVHAGGTAVGIDPCEPMLRAGQEKLRAQGINGEVKLVLGEAEALPVPDGTFDCATIGFALRNVTDIDKTFAELARAVRPGGKVVALEIAKPRNALVRGGFSVYFYRVSPLLARMLGGDPKAYQYLPNSLKQFKSREELCESMRRAGLTDVHFHDLNLGTVCVHVGTVQALNVTCDPACGRVA